MIKKPVGLIISAGRTGTNFLGSRIEEILPCSSSFHEPDLIHKWPDIFRAIQYFGLYKGFIGKILRRTGPRNVSRRLIRGEITSLEAGLCLKRERKKFYEKQQTNIVIEANYAFFGLLTALPYAFQNYRAAIIVRDPRTWISSWLHHNPIYGKNNVVDRFKLGRLNPTDTKEYKIQEMWDSLDISEKLAWFWNFVYSTAVKISLTDPNIRIFSFEDMFCNKYRCNYFKYFINFLISFEEYSFKPNIPDNFLSIPINTSLINTNYYFKKSPEEASKKWCSPLMEKLGYFE